MKRMVLVLAALGAAVLFLGCPKLPPIVLPTPPPTNPPTTCPAGQVPVPDGFGGGTHCEPEPVDPHKPVCADGNVSGCWHHPPEGWRYNCKGATPTVQAPAECPASPPVPTPPAGCEPLPGPAVCQHKGTEPGDLPPDAKGEHDDAVKAAITAACAKVGCPTETTHNGTWQEFVFTVGASFPAGYCVTYDYLSGDSGHGSEMSVRRVGSTRVVNYQIESTQGLIRRPPGGYRSVCEGGGEGQPIKAPALPPPPPPPPPPTDSCLPAPPLGKLELKSVGVNRVVIDATPKSCADREWNTRCSTGNTCSPGAGEGNPNRTVVEASWGPWTWTIDGVPCIESGACWLDNKNPLRIVAPGTKGKRIRVTGGNGVFGEVVP
jgi:hypothetical protein